MLFHQETLLKSQGLRSYKLFPEWQFQPRVTLSPRHVTTNDSIENDTLRAIYLFSRTTEDITKFLNVLEISKHFTQNDMIFSPKKSFLRGHHI
jgi:hypothetical protein